MNIRLVTFLAGIFVSVGVLRADFNITVEGDASSAPVYVLNGTGTTSFKINETALGSIVCSGDFTFSMDTVATGNVNAVGAYDLTGDDGGGEWDARFEGSTKYLIRKFGNFIVVSFNHTLRSAAGTQKIFDRNYSTATITSRGTMTLTGDWELSGNMSGIVSAQGATRLRHPYRNTPFVQQFADMDVADWGVWDADIDVDVNGKRLTGGGDLTVGPADDPVDTVTQTVKGSTKGSLFSWTATGTGADKRVVVRITNTSADIVDGKNSINAAGQDRKF